MRYCDVIHAVRLPHHRAARRARRAAERRQRDGARGAGARPAEARSSRRRCATASSARSRSAPLATLLAVYLIRLGWVKLVGAGYLLYLRLQPLLRGGGRRGAPHAAARRSRGWACRAFWATVVKVELTDIVFAIDSILVAVAMSPKIWVILTGGILGIVDDAARHRQAAGARRALSAARRRRVRHHRVGRRQAADRVPAHARATSRFEIPKWLSLGLIVVIFGVALSCTRA